MKKQILIGLILLSPILTINAQIWSGSTPGNIYYNQGNVGIGTTTVSSPLTISKPTGHLLPTIDVIHISNNPGCAGCINIGHKISVLDDQGTYKSNIGLWINAKNAQNNYAAIFENGNVGIGTSSPIAKLHIENGVNTDAAVLATSSEYNKLIVSSGTTQPVYVSTFKIIQEFNNDRNNGYISFHRGGSTSGGFLTFGSFGQERLRIDGFGNIGIGTISPVYKLDVCGTIRAKEVVVDLNGTCVPDFVFKSDYKLMDLKELEQFVKINQHLPEIASEKELVENGVNMKDLQMKLLQKIEELTLYTIEQNKKLEQQNEKITTLENEMKEMKKK